MAIKHIRSSNREMTVEEFKEWLKKFDTDNDGRISKAELQGALRSNGGRLVTLRSSRLVRQLDGNRNGFIDDSEIDGLVAFAQKNLGMRISQY